MYISTVLYALVLATMALAIRFPAKPQPATLLRPRTNAEAFALGLPPLKPRLCDAECKANRLARRQKASQTALPARSLQYRKTCEGEVYDFSGSNAVMSATCENSAGQEFYTQIDLNQCISPNDGERL